MSQDTSESPGDDDAGTAGVSSDADDFTVQDVQKELRGGANTVAWGGEGAGRGKAAQIYLGVLDVDSAGADGELGGFYIRPQVTNRPVGSWEVHRVVVGDKTAPWRFTLVGSPPADCSTDQVSVEHIVAFVDWRGKSNEETSGFWTEESKDRLRMSKAEWEILQRQLKSKF